MRLFSCPSCRQVVFFNNVKCERCELLLGYDDASNRILALRPDTEAASSLIAVAGRGDNTRWAYCANRAHDVCNWLLPLANDAPPVAGALCRACRHNLTIPDLSVDQNVVLWRRIEEAKHRLLYTILRLDLPIAVHDPSPGPAAVRPQ